MKYLQRATSSLSQVVLFYVGWAIFNASDQDTITSCDPENRPRSLQSQLSPIKGKNKHECSHISASSHPWPPPQLDIRCHHGNQTLSHWKLSSLEIWTLIENSNKRARVIWCSFFTRELIWMFTWSDTTESRTVNAQRFSHGEPGLDQLWDLDNES